MQLFVEHFHSGKFRKSKILSRSRIPFVMGSSRAASLRLLGKNIEGVHAVLEYRKPYWYLVACGGNVFLNEQKILEHKVKGGEYLRIGDHDIRLEIQDEKTEFHVHNDEVSGDLNTQQIVILSKRGVLETKFISATEAFHFFDGEKDVSYPPAKSSEWEVEKLGNFQIKRRLTTRPTELQKKSFRLELVQSQENRTSFIASTAFLLILGLSILSSRMLQTDKVEAPKNNKFVKMIYDSQVVEKLQKEAKQLQTKKFSTPQQRKVASTPVQKQQVATKAIKKIRAAGLSKLVGKIAKRANSQVKQIKINGKSADRLDTSRSLSSLSSSSTKSEKAKNLGKQYKLAAVSTDGKSSGSESYKKGTQLGKANVGSANVNIIEEETKIEGGLDKEVIAEYIRSKLGQIRYCYERQLSAQPDLHGKVLVKFIIGPKGEVSTQSVGSTTLNNAKVEGCILRRVSKWVFPSPKGGTKVKVTYPFLFKSIN